MKTGRTLSQLAFEIERQTTSKRDYHADTRQLEMTTDGLLVVGDRQLEPTSNCHNQIASRLEIPRAYYDKMRTDAPTLFASNVNHWMQANPEQRMIRTLDGKARAFLSAKYRTLDNFELMQAVLPVLAENKCEFASAEVTENRLYLKVIFPEHALVVPGSKQVNDVVQAGLVISNSEVGAGSLRVEPLLYRLVCTNGMILNTAMRKYHVGRGKGENYENIQEILRDETRELSDRAFWMQVQDVVRSSISHDIFSANVAKIAETTSNLIVGDPVKAVELVRKSYGLSDALGGNIMNHLIAGGDLSQWGLANAVTFAANYQNDYEVATELERVGGKIIDLSPKEWSTIARVG